MSGLDIIGGIALILFGIRFLRKGLDRMFGGRLLVWLTNVTRSGPRAFAAGMAAGAVTPSSTSISLLAVQLIGDARVRTTGVLAMVLGAHVGMTVLAQSMAFRVQDYALVGIVVGVAAFLYAKRDILRGIGQTVLALGFIFLAIQWIGDGANGLSASEEGTRALALLDGHPWIVLPGTALLAVIMQSSTATIGLGVGLCASGLLGAPLLVAWILGTNLGVGVSMLLAGWGSTEGRRLAVANLFAKALPGLPLMLFPAVGEWALHHLPGDAARQTVMGHTAFNLLVGLLALPLLGALLKLAAFVVPVPIRPLEAGAATHLDPRVLETPSLALARATRETLRMADKVRAQLESFWQACRSGDVTLARRVKKDDDIVDRHNRELIDYLGRITGEKSPRDNRWQLALMNFSVELEAVGDMVEKQLCDLVAKQRDEGATLTPADWAELEGVYKLLLERFDRAMSLLTRPDPAEAEALIAGKRAINEDCRRLQAEHYERFRMADTASRAASCYFLDYLNGFRRIHSQVTGLAYVMTERKDGDA